MQIQAGLGLRGLKFYHFVSQEISLPTTECFEKHTFLQLHAMNNFVRGGVAGINFFFLEGISSLFSSKIIKITQHI